MSAFPLLTLLTAVPLLGAAIALFSGRQARAVALIATLASLTLALVIWTQLHASGGFELVERHAWAPSLGIEYHLGVDGLGALMLVLSAIVTLMSVDAAHRVHHQPGLYFALVLVFEAGLFGSFTALNFFHWFLFWELSLIPAFFLIKLWGGARRGPAATQFFVYTMAGSVALLVAFLAVFVVRPAAWTSASDAAGLDRRIGADGHGASRPGHALAGDRSAGWLCRQGADDSLPHLAARGLCRSAFAGDDAADRRHVEDGRLWPAAHCAAALWPSNLSDAHAAAGAGRGHGRDGRLGRRGAEGSEAHLCLLVGESPGLLFAGNLCAGGSGGGGRRRRPARPSRSTA